MQMTRKIEISHRTIIFAFVFAISMWFMYYIRDILLQLFVSLLLVAILHPIVTKMSQFKIPRAVAIIFSYIIVIGIFALSIAVILPPLVEQTTNLVNNLPGYIQSLGLTKYLSPDLLKEVISQLGAIPSQLIKIGLSLFANVINVLTVLIFTFYLLLNREKFDDSLKSWFGKEKSEQIYKVVNEVENRLGGWSRGQFLLMLLVGISSYVGLLILGIPYALPVAFLAGIFEIIPYIGPIVAAVPAVILGFSISPFVGGAAIALAILIQQVENYIFVPKVMEKSTGVSPIIILLALSIGSKLAGVVGMIISIPIVLTLQTIIQLKFKDK